MLRMMVICLGVAIVGIFGYYLYTSDQKQDEYYIRPDLSVVTSGISGTREYGSEKDQYVSYDRVTHIYRDNALGFSLMVPIGYLETPSADVFRSADESGDTGYADRSGTAIAIGTFPKPIRQLPFDWFSESDDRLLSLREGINGRVAGKQSFHYKADWGESGQSLGVAIDGDDYILKIDCFHPPTDDFGSKSCSDVLLRVTESLNMKVGNAR